MNTEANTDATRVTSMRQRLGAMLERGVDAIGPWGSRRILRELQHVLDPSVSEVEGGRRAAAFAQWYAGATPEQRSECWVLMSEHFAPDVAAIESAHAAYEAVRGTDDEARAEVQLRRAFTAPRTRLLQRFSAYSGGVHFLVDLRAELLPHLKKDKRLIALDGELQELFSTWFDVGFLELRRISWDSPAALIEKLIRYEAVHDIRSWQDAKNRLDEDRRCYSFFHPRMPGEPLIFVEVALLREMAGGIVPLLDEEAAPADLDKASCAIFYSISNTQSGLKGVSFGDELIKRVVEVLQGEFPRLKLFATLSPIPGFRAWLDGFGWLRDLRDSGEMNVADATQLLAHLDWIQKEIPIPARFARRRNGYHKEAHGVSWVKAEATEFVRHLYAIADILQRYDTSVEVVRTTRPGYVVYEDDWQLVAEPFHGENH